MTCYRDEGHFLKEKLIMSSNFLRKALKMSQNLGSLLQVLLFHKINIPSTFQGPQLSRNMTCAQIHGPKWQT